VVLTKIIDKSSTSLIGAVLTGQNIKSGTLAFTKGGANAVEYYVLTLTDLLVKAIQQSEAAGVQKLTEQVTMTAVKFKFDYRPQNPDGTLGPPKTFTFDCKQNKAG
jgi:type VI secretion system secreted protein Hcp